MKAGVPEVKGSVSARRVSDVGGDYFSSGCSKLPSLEGCHAVKQDHYEAGHKIKFSEHKVPSCSSGSICNSQFAILNLHFSAQIASEGSEI